MTEDEHLTSIHDPDPDPPPSAERLEEMRQFVRSCRRYFPDVPDQSKALARALDMLDELLGVTDTLELEAVRVLDAVDSGALTVALVSDRPEKHPEYRASNGWHFRIFDHGGDWNYIESFRRPGDEWTDAEYESFRRVVNWQPSTREKRDSQWQWNFQGTSPGGYRV